MQNELTISFATLYAFLLVLIRISGVFVFVPLPGSQSGPSVARIVASVACTIALYGRWPSIAVSTATPATITAWVLSEAAIGIVAGLAIGFISESLVLGAQVLSLQTGYGYASVIDPTTQADSGVLLVVAQLFAGMLFFAFGFDRQVIAALANSLDSWPPGSFVVTRPLADELVRLASSIFSVGLRVALPITGLLLMVDIALALLGRMQSQLQVTLLALPAKMLIGLLMLAGIATLFPSIVEKHAHRVLQVTTAVLNR